MARLEQYVDELIMEKFRQKQLSRSELTFRDLETIKNSFVKILAGHFHSRIEYPKMRDPDAPRRTEGENGRQPEAEGPRPRENGG
jgi:cyclic-di-AMP phosphodiesterase PgpH